MVGIETESALFQTTGSHGGIYTDPVTKLNRNYDIRATIRSGVHELLMSVEVKRLHHSNPIVGSRMPRAHAEAFHCVISPSDNGVNSFSIGDEHERVYRDHEGRVYHQGDLVAKSFAIPDLNEKKGKSIDVTKRPELFAKFTQALNSVESMLRDRFMQEESCGAAWSQSPRTQFAALPILVVPDGCLWVVDYNQDGSRTDPPKMVDEFTLFVGRRVVIRREIDPFVISHQHFVTVTGFATIIEHLNGRTPGLFSAFFDWIYQ